MKYAALNAAKDLFRGGPAFLMGGIGAGLRRGSESTLKLGEREIHIRPRTSDFEVCRQVFRDRQYEIHAPVQRARAERMYDALLAAGRTPVIVDAGANIGVSAIWFAQAWPRATIIAIEPDPGNARLARANLSGLGRVVIHEAAIGSRAGFVAVHPAEQPYATTTERSESGCPVVTVEGVLGQIADGGLFIVKLDIEGFEDDLFETNTGWLDAACVVYIEPHDHIFPERATSRNFQAEMGKRNFDMLINGENLIYVRREEAAR